MRVDMRQLMLSCVLLCATATAALAGAGGPCATSLPHSLPEPASIALLAAGIGGIFAIRRFKGRK